MRENKAFTLIELLAVIVILALIVLIAVPSINHLIKSSKKKAYETQITVLEQAASKWSIENDNLLDETKTFRLTIDKLMEEGYIGKRENNIIINPIDNSKMRGCVKIKYDQTSNQYTYNYDDDCSTDIACFDYAETSVVTDYTINYDSCLAFVSDNPESLEQKQAFCRGEGRLESLSMMTFDEYIKSTVALSAFYYEEFAEIGIIENLKRKEGFAITNYKCGGNVLTETTHTSGEDLDPIIPNMINNKPVILIESASFGNDDKKIVDSVTFPNTLLYIQPEAFSQNQLKKVTFSEGLIGILSRSFYGNQIKKLNLPDSLKILGQASFSINQIENVQIGKNIEMIDAYTFMSNKITELTIPSSVTYIHQQAFIDNKLKELVIPNSVLFILNHAFSKNEISKVSIPSHTILGGGILNDNQMSDDKSFIYKQNSDGTIDKTTVISYAGSKRDIITTPNNIKVIGADTFSNVTIGNVIISEGVTKIGNWAFSNSNLKTVILPSTLQEIGEVAFRNCNLTTVTIPKNVKLIGQMAFGYQGAYNQYLNKIVNQTGLAFDWGKIVNGTSGFNFVTGTVTNKYASTIISAS